MKVKLLAVYEKQKRPGVKFTYDKTSKKRPAWIKLIKPKIKSGFLRIRINGVTEEVYRSFGYFYYPWGVTQKEGKKFYAKMAKNYDQVVGQNNSIWARKIVKKLEKMGLKKDGHVIDLGAGTGIAAEVLAERGYQKLTLVDYSPEMLAIAKNKPKLAKAKFILADVKQLNLKKKYDAVISIMLLDKFENDKELSKVLKKVKKIMKPGALISLVEDNQEKNYSQFFQKIEEGSLQTKTLNLTRYYFIGKNLPWKRNF